MFIIVCYWLCLEFGQDFLVSFVVPLRKTPRSSHELRFAGRKSPDSRIVAPNIEQKNTYTSFKKLFFINSCDDVIDIESTVSRSIYRQNYHQGRWCTSTLMMETKDVSETLIFKLNIDTTDRPGRPLHIYST
jgi:hypothetical protein